MTHGHVSTSQKLIYPLLPLLRLSSPLACRDNQGHLLLFKDFNVFRPRLSQSSLPQDYQVRLHAETIKVIYLFSKTSMSFDQDYHSLLCPETIKSVTMQRQSRSSASFQRLQCLLTKTITFFFASETIKSVGLRRQSGSSTFTFQRLS